MPTRLQRALQLAREVAEDILRPMAEKVDREGHWPEEALRTLQESGLGGLTVPREYGGLGHGMHGLAMVCEILGNACPSTALCFGMHAVGAAVISAKATPHHQKSLLTPIVEGRHLTTLALSEPGSGVHFYFPETVYEESGDDYVVTGSKSFVTNGGRADSYVMSVAGAGTESGQGTFSCVVVRKDVEGLGWGPPWEGLGMRGNSSLTLKLDGARVPKADLLGDEGEEIWYVFNVIAPYFLVAMSGVYLGIANSALSKAVSHVSTRRYAHTGSGPANNPIVQSRLGELWAHVERTRRLIYGAAVDADEGDERALPAILSCKAEVAEAAVNVVNESMTLMGGIAYAEGSDMERLLRDVRAAHVMAPTTDLLRTWVGRWLLDIPILGD